MVVNCCFLQVNCEKGEQSVDLYSQLLTSLLKNVYWKLTIFIVVVVVTVTELLGGFVFMLYVKLRYTF